MALIRAHEQLGQAGERLGASALLLHVGDRLISCACSGHVRAIICRNGNAFNVNRNPLNLTADEYRQIRAGNATVTEVSLILKHCPSNFQFQKFNTTKCQHPHSYYSYHKVFLYSVLYMNIFRSIKKLLLLFSLSHCLMGWKHLDTQTFVVKLRFSQISIYLYFIFSARYYSYHREDTLPLPLPLDQTSFHLIAATLYC